MDMNQWTNYEKFLVMCGKTKILSPTYAAYMEFKELKVILKHISTSGTGQFVFEGKSYKSPITSATATQILGDIEIGEFNGSMVSVANEVKLRIF